MRTDNATVSIALSEPRRIVRLVLLLVVALLLVPTPASAQDSAAVISCRVLGDLSDADKGRLLGSLEEGLRTGLTPTVASLDSARTRLDSVAPEVLGCFTTGCLVTAGQALTTSVGYVAEIKEEYEIYTTKIAVYDLQTGKRMKLVEGTCEICAPDEAVDSIKDVTSQATAGWTYPGGTAPAPVIVKVPDEPVVTPPVPDPKPDDRVGDTTVATVGPGERECRTRRDREIAAGGEQLDHGARSE